VAEMASPTQEITLTRTDCEPPTLIHVSLTAQGNATLLEFKVVGLGSERDWVGLVNFLERIWGHALDNLKAVLEKGQK
jgi:hypothetical protein